MSAKNLKTFMLKPFKKTALKKLIIGHRGASGYAPENTLASFEEALRLKADMIELDIQLTSDDQWIVIHDLTLKRTCGLAQKVLSTPLSVIQTLDAGSWFSPSFAGEGIMTLDQLLTWGRSRININIEIKGKAKKKGKSIETLLEKIADHKMTRHVILSSFEWRTLRKIRQLNRTIPIGVLVNREPRLLYMREAIDLKAFSIHFPVKKIKKELIEMLHDRQIKVWLYTVDQAEEMAKYFQMGVDGIFTNYPDLPRRKGSYK
jgi:glycerophosphoryl diester phosphodiesterase